MSRVHGVVLHAHHNDEHHRNRSFLDSVDIPSLILVYWSKEVLEQKDRNKDPSMVAYSRVGEACIRISPFPQI